MPTQTRTRYPGAYSFSDDAVSRKLFYGREQESTALAHRILANRLVVLFARSGLGKTSLLNAGVADQLRAEHCLPLSVRVNDAEQGPLASIYRDIELACQRQSVEYVPGDKTSLWHFFKSAQFWRNDILLTPVLILDQFEELFTLHSEQQRGAFLDQFSNLVRGVRPERAESGEQEASYSDAAPVVKIVLSLREDFLAQLDEISDRIPGILDQRFRLLPLGREAAAKALDAPAGVEDPALATRPFRIDPRAQAAILDFLERRAAVPATRSTSNIEPFQLQLICQHVEEIAQKAQRKHPDETITVSMADIGGESKLRKILTEFYRRQVAAVPSFRQRHGVRRLCSEFLISPHGRRLRMEESEIQRLTRVKPKSLQILVDRRLVRRDQSLDGNYYELSHDSLIVPIIDSVRLWFLVRMAFFLLLALVLVGYTAMASIGFLAVWFAAISGEAGALDGMEQFRNPWFHAMVLFIVLAMAYWGIRNFRQSREMWRRFKI